MIPTMVPMTAAIMPIRSRLLKFVCGRNDFGPTEAAAEEGAAERSLKLVPTRRESKFSGTGAEQSLSRLK